MKKIISISLTFCLAVVLMFSCKKKDTKVVMADNITVPVLKATPNVVLIDSAAAKDSLVALTFSWLPADYGYPAAANYVLEVAPAGTDWSAARKFDVANKLKTEHTNLDLNTMVTIFGLVENVEGEIMARVSSKVKSELGLAEIPVVYSNTVVVKVTPYKKAPPAAVKFYMPGDYQGWTPSAASCQFLEAAPGTSLFKGIVEKTKPDGTLSSGGFKFTPQPNWDYDFGDNGSNYASKINGSGIIGPKSAGTNGNDFKLDDGTYALEVDTIALTWKYSLENWALTGDATPLSWPAGPGGTPGQDQNMRYNQATKMYEITIDLIGGKSIKVRKNDDWGVNLGNAVGADGDLIVTDNTPIACTGGGKNMGIPADGNYTISLDVDGKKIMVKKN
jgi:starch-binding outer membrane protein SusE/F